MDGKHKKDGAAKMMVGMVEAALKELKGE